MMSSSFASKVPEGAAVRVRIIDSTSKIGNFPTTFIMKPSMSGFTTMPEIPTWSFLIEHDSGRKILFDLGIPVDWENLAPKVAKGLKTSRWNIAVDHSTKQILEEQGISSNAIEAIVWSHWHWDHIGNPDHFPASTKLIVGPGFKAEKLPAYPENAKADVRQSDFAGRELLEISFTEKNALTLGAFRACDYFSDGSFYLLDAPGHAVGHLAGLARTTTSPPTFILMGGDLTHHGGELRPSPHRPLPDAIPRAHLAKLCSALDYRHSCPGELVERLQHTRDREPGRERPFFDPAMGHDINEAIRTIAKVQQADADEDVWYVSAHDTSLRGIVDFFPAEANLWKDKSWRERTFWRFLEDFELALRHTKAMNETKTLKTKL